MAEERFDVKVEITITDVTSGTPVKYSHQEGESFNCTRVAMHGIETVVTQALLALGDEAIKLKAAEGETKAADKFER